MRNIKVTNRTKNNREMKDTNMCIRHRRLERTLLQLPQHENNDDDNNNDEGDKTATDDDENRIVGTRR